MHDVICIGKYESSRLSQRRFLAIVPDDYDFSSQSLMELLVPFFFNQLRMINFKILGRNGFFLFM